ncbi:MAG: DUF4915 domain-containing protein [Cyanobacteriota bacterium]
MERTFNRCTGLCPQRRCRRQPGDGQHPLQLSGSPSESHSFRPQWRPPLISRLAAEDRSHLNGLALRGKGWAMRNRLLDHEGAGQLLRMSSTTPRMCHAGLAMPPHIQVPGMACRKLIRSRLAGLACLSRIRKGQIPPGETKCEVSGQMH